MRWSEERILTTHAAVCRARRSWSACTCAARRATGSTRRSSKRRGAQRVVAAINRALVNVPRDRVRMHVCWGNYEGPHDLDVPLAAILPIIRQTNVGGFVFPFANPRHAHEYRCFGGGVWTTIRSWWPA